MKEVIESGPLDRFFSPLSAMMKLQVQKMCEVVNDRGDYIVLFTARKAHCIADIAHRLGLLFPSEQHYSTRILDGDCSLLRGQRVLIVEDIVSSGRMLWSIVKEVEKWEPQVIEAFVFSFEGNPVNVENIFRSKLPELKLVPPIVRCEPGDSVTSAQSIVKALGAVPRPLNIDWPIYQSTEKLSSWKLEKLRVDGDESMITPDQPFNLVSNLAPSEVLAHSLPNTFRKLDNRIQLEKIRIYPYSSSRSKTTALAVSIVIIDSVDSHDATKLIDAINSNFGTGLESTGYLAQDYRILQYLLSVIFAESSLGKDIPIYSDHYENLRYLFTPNVCESMSSVTVTITERIREKKETNADRWNVAPTIFKDNVTTFLEGKALTESLGYSTPFLISALMERYSETKEYQLRQQLKYANNYADGNAIFDQLIEESQDAGSARLTNRQFREILSVEIERIFPSTEETRRDVNVAFLASQFIDQGIDAGWIVPTIEISGGKVVRKFRPGEVIAFAEEVRSACEVALHAFSSGKRDNQDAKGNQTIGKDMAEKLVVALIRDLVKKDLIVDYRFRAEAGLSSELMQFAWASRGAVLAEPGDSFIAPPGDPRSLELLIRDGVLISTEKGFLIPHELVLEPSVKFSSYANTIGALIAELMNLKSEREKKSSPIGSPLIDVDSFSKLVTLVGGRSNALAIGADIGIATKGLNLGNYHSKQDWIQSTSVETINQGLAKAAWIEDDRSKALIAAINTRFANKSTQTKFDWLGFSDTLRDTEIDSHINTLLKKESLWLIEAFLLDIAFRAALTVDGSERKAVLSRGLANKAYLTLIEKIKIKKSSPSHELRGLIMETEVGNGTIESDRNSLMERAQDLATKLKDDASALIEECYELESSKERLARNTEQPIVRGIFVLSASEFDADAIRQIQPNSQVDGQIGICEFAETSELDLVAILGLRSNADGPGVVGLLRQLTDIRPNDYAIVLFGLPPRLAPTRGGTRIPSVSQRFRTLLREISRVSPERKGVVVWRDGQTKPLDIAYEECGKIDFQGVRWKLGVPLTGGQFSQQSLFERISDDRSTSSINIENFVSGQFYGSPVNLGHDNTVEVTHTQINVQWKSEVRELEVILPQIVDVGDAQILREAIAATDSEDESSVVSRLRKLSKPTMDIVKGVLIQSGSAIVVHLIGRI